LQNTGNTTKGLALIQVKVRTILEFTKVFGRSRFEVTLAVGSTVGDLLEKLTSTFGEELAAQLFEPDRSRLLPHIGLMVNGRSIGLLNSMETVLHDNDEILILPPVGGG
jgi:molybdopterin synthase sulfur carrier subunit